MEFSSSNSNPPPLQAQTIFIFFYIISLSYFFCQLDMHFVCLQQVLKFQVNCKNPIKIMYGNQKFMLHTSIYISPSKPVTIKSTIDTGTSSNTIVIP